MTFAGEQHMRYRQIVGGALVAGLMLCLAPRAGAADSCVGDANSRCIPGSSGTAFSLTAKADRAMTGEGSTYLFWGFTDGVGRPQYPGPTLIATEGQTITIAVSNKLAGTGQNVSLTFPGISNVTAACTQGKCAQGQIGLEAPLDAQVTYTLSNVKPGTYHYTSGTRPDLQIEMGLVGALIVRPTMGGKFAYDEAQSKFDREFLFLLTEMDSHVHDMVEDAVNNGLPIDSVVDSEGHNINQRLATYFPNYWFLNGRNAPDSLAEDQGTGINGRYPTQPYGSLVKVHPGDQILMRVIGAGHDLHPFHHHGNHARIIATDGHLLQSAPGAGIDLSHQVFTIQSVPGQTVDALFSWSGEGLGWDAYGVPHAAQLIQTCDGKTVASNAYDPVTHEWCGDHNKKIPVLIQDQLGIQMGEFYSGSPFLGYLGPKPVGSLNLNPDAGFTFMWHSHTEKEITNFDIFPGGIMTMLMVVPYSVQIEP
jgi:FtsP/CotA-like multicopper oxidase with cupredoxin domain